LRRYSTCRRNGWQGKKPLHPFPSTQFRRPAARSLRGLARQTGRRGRPRPDEDHLVPEEAVAGVDRVVGASPYCSRSAYASERGRSESRRSRPSTWLTTLLPTPEGPLSCVADADVICPLETDSPMAGATLRLGGDMLREPTIDNVPTLQAMAVLVQVLDERPATLRANAGRAVRDRRPFHHFHTSHDLGQRGTSLTWASGLPTPVWPRPIPDVPIGRMSRWLARRP
jgi:hypothetical protein